ncbi:GHKL domain-containing protein, partial [Sporosarcina sp. NCCP-2378]|uniref:GHKL domain-containing protein n=2 Tax=unclassified Sporosarcina TaxID=2647733 RepID=UPI00222E60F7
LNGFSHVYVYRQLAGYDRLSVRMMLAVSVLFTVFLQVAVTVTGYPELNGILLFVFLLGIGFMRGGMPIIHNVLYALGSTAGLTLTRLVGLESAMKLYMESPWNLYIWTPSLLHLLVSVLILIAAVVGRRQIALFGRYAVMGRFYAVSYVLLTASFVALMLLSSPASLMSAAWYQQAAYVSYVAAFVLFFLLLTVLLVSWQIAKDRMAERQQMLLDNEMLAYVGKLEAIHDDFISFRHDYLNVLLALDEGVRQKDLALIEDVYTNVVAPTSEQLKLREYDLLKLSRIEVPEVKSVLAVKVMTAYQQNVDVMIDIPETVESIAMPVTDFIRVITILLDNAIEEAVASEEKQLQLALFDTPAIQYIIVRNSSRAESADIRQLYAKQYSNKKNGRGIGLFSLKRILDKSSYATLETSSAAHLFSQQLLLKKEADRS